MNPLLATNDDRPDSPDQPDALVARAEDDRHRPRFHFVSPAGWLNDPNGLSHWNGVYHLFYQYNPLKAVHSRIHWGHATSPDLVTWTDAPVALVPGDDATAPDADGCWSGVLVDDHGVPTLVYSGRRGDRELPCVAVGSPDLTEWVADAANPVIAAPPASLELTAFRDHCVWPHPGGGWRQLIGSGIRGQGGTALLYESPDLRNWSYLGPLIVGDSGDRETTADDWTGTMWECVDLFRLETAGADDEPVDPDVLVFSAWDDGVTRHTLYLTGRYSGTRFERTAAHRLDYGGRYFYAPQSTLDARGRRVMFGWLQEGRSDAAAETAGWSGVMSLPRLVTRAPDGTLFQQPVPELETLRRDHVRLGGFTLTGGERRAGLTPGDQIDIVAELHLEPGAEAELVVRATDDGAERTVIRFSRPVDPHADVTLELIRTASSLDPTVDATPRGGPIRHADGRIHVRALVDHSALEIFANGQPLACRVYPTRSDANGVEFAGIRGRVRVHEAESWRMADIWHAPRRLWPTP